MANKTKTILISPEQEEWIRKNNINLSGLIRYLLDQHIRGKIK